MNEKRKNLHLAQITPEQSSRTCGPYWYIITNGAMSYTAFRRRESFLNWLQERGLSLEHDLVEQGKHDAQHITGEFEEISHMSYDEFFGLPNIVKETRVLSNGSYTLGIITEKDGIRQIHHLNPNCKHRPKFDYFESTGLFG